MTVHSPLLNNVPVGKGRYSYQTHASLVGMVYSRSVVVILFKYYIHNNNNVHLSRAHQRPEHSH